MQTRGHLLRIRKFVVGPYLGVSGVVGPNQSSVDFGFRFGAHW